MNPICLINIIQVKIKSRNRNYLFFFKFNKITNHTNQK